MKRPLPILVFSDLDGTLLDHKTYSWSAAKPGLKRLAEIGAGVVLASSKTAQEIMPLRDSMGQADMPAIVENGAGILWPDNPDEGKDDYPRLRALLKKLPQGFVGFGDMTIDEVAQKTGLSSRQANLARQRKFSEPGVWTGSDVDLAEFLEAARAHGLYARKGGRFLTISFGQTKADAMREVVRHLHPVRTIALGDAPNDIEMIQAADQGVVVANPHGPNIPPFPAPVEARVLRTQQSGPQGWSDAILTLTADLR
ncbi:MULTISPECIES: HAD-IIB family hydrolase [unclassified Ruegeria]|uniref:HAD-IIB family hydrolase n=1 Tax=unclassified Ruegeria TaxID=2625375 RepID=UPI001ADA93E7|nr:MULTISPECIES: HAD-IIB family hydrolase [unclassified Ruegeria]MBO9412432.1 HAD-IIB family hydrolase [Ruegeria sp. R8_1]MBO9416330.1 HAD-IIB family hydrolase [Ruegeria sp. R8_2]